MRAIKIKSERGRLERFLLHMTLFMQRRQERRGLFMEYNLWRERGKHTKAAVIEG